MNVVQEIERIKVSEAKLGIFGGLSKVYNCTQLQMHHASDSFIYIYRLSEFICL